MLLMRIALGSAQFGMNYGISNKKGKIPKNEVFKILEKAINSGVKVIDTAFDYGDSEKVIGEFEKRNKLNIITKGNVENFEESLKNLKVDRLYGYLIHNFRDFQNKNQIWDDLKEKKEKGKVKKIGFSLYYPKEVLYLLENKIIPDILQIPYNLFDRRFECLFDELKNKDIEIHVRSIFLQGLVFKKNFKGRFAKIKDKMDLLNNISKISGIPKSSICINFALLNKNIDYLVLGIDGIENFAENLNSSKFKKLVKKYMIELKRLKVDDENIIIPSNWKNRIEGKIIYLRKITENDASMEYCNWLNAPSINRYLETKEANIEYLKSYIKEKNHKKDCLFFGIFDKESNKHIGNVKLEPIEDKKATFGILIGERSYWGKGIGMDVTRTILEYTFNTLELEKVDLGVINRNKRAKKLYEKAGFEMIEAKKDSIKMEIKKENFKKVVAIIQARMGSKRLPGKMMMDLDGKPVIWHSLKNATKAKLVDKVVLATSFKKENEEMINAVKNFGFPVFIGSEEDVLDRYYQAAKEYGADIVVRITGDCPLIDSEIIDKVISFFNENKCDYASNVDPPTFPDGMDVEVFSFETLEKSWRKAKLTSEREHVTSFIRKNENLFNIKNFKNEQDLSEYRLTLDEKEDLIAISKIIRKLNVKNNYHLEDIINVLENDKEISKINEKYDRNEGYKKSLKEDKILD